MESSVMLGSISFFIQPHFGGFLAMAMHRAIGACRCGAVFGGDGDGNQNAMATAEGRLVVPYVAKKRGCIFVATLWL